MQNQRSESLRTYCASLEEFENNLSEPPLRKLMDYWLSLRRGEDLPSKSELNPCVMGEWTGNTFLYRYHPNRQDFEIRILGDEIQKPGVWVHSPGRFLSEFADADEMIAIRDRWSACLNGPTVMCVSHSSDGETTFERLLLPVRDKNRSENPYIFGMVLSHKRSRYDREYKNQMSYPDSIVALDVSLIPEAMVPAQ